MKIKLLMAQRVLFDKDAILEVSESEATRLCSLGFAEKVAAVKKAEEPVEKPKKEKRK
jgi:hypothetical protein